MSFFKCARMCIVLVSKIKNSLRTLLCRDIWISVSFNDLFRRNDVLINYPFKWLSWVDPVNAAYKIMTRDGVSVQRCRPLYSVMGIRFRVCNDYTWIRVMASSDLVKKVIQLKLQLKDTSRSTTVGYVCAGLEWHPQTLGGGHVDLCCYFTLYTWLYESWASQALMSTRSQLLR